LNVVPFSKPSRKRSRAPAPTAKGRKQDLVKAAYHLVVALGLEGLRTRLVAERVGINIATLHYYFPTKEALIGGVASYLSSQFAEIHAPPVPVQKSQALTRLQQEFADARFYLLQRPDMLVVLEELGLRARRDSAVRRVIEPFTRFWEGGLRTMIETGIAEGVFRADATPAPSATFLAAALAGALRSPDAPTALNIVCSEIERWLRSGAAQI
jgi:AcrR family transcriptional regulator